MQTGLPRGGIDRRRSATAARLEHAVTRYLQSLLDAFRPGVVPGTRCSPGTTPIADQVFDKLTNRQFSYLGRTRSVPYRDRALATLKSDVAQGRPLRFFFDIGPGYHASIDLGSSGLAFHIGLGEFLALRQVRLFDCEVRRIYAPGVKFYLVIDNLCGLYTNDVPLERSRQYVRRLRRLVEQLDLDDTVEVLAESEIFSTAQYEAILSGLECGEPPVELSDEDIGNVARFLGRECCAREAAERIERYRRTGTTTETLLADVVDGVRLTQRATDATLGFRSFPGGAQRIQAGEIMVAVDEAERTRPVLLTSRNHIRYDIRPLATEGLLPPAIREIRYVRLLPHPDRRQRRKL